MLKKIWKIFLILFCILLFFSVIRPAYIKYKSNKKEVVVDTSGELAMTEYWNNKSNIDFIETENLNNKENNSDDENKWKLERKEYDPFVVDERILLYEGNIDSGKMNQLMDVLIEDITSQTYAKLDIVLNGNTITYSDIESYKNNLNSFKNSISSQSNYNVKFEYGTGVVNKIIITNI